MLDFNVIGGILLAAALVLSVIYVFPVMRKKFGTDIYTDMKLGLLMFGYAFRDEKVKEMTDIILGIVTAVEKLDKSAQDKQQMALQVAFQELMIELNINLDAATLDTIIAIAVSYLPATHPVESK